MIDVLFRNPEARNTLKSIFSMAFLTKTQHTQEALSHAEWLGKKWEGRDGRRVEGKTLV